MIGDFQDYLRRAEEMLADPERTDPARLAIADQRLPAIRKHWDELVEISRPLLHKGMGAVDFVDFLMTGLAATGVPVEDVAALLAVGVLRSYETARRRFCTAAADPGHVLVCALPPHVSDFHVGLDADRLPNAWRGDA
ncbi:MAG: hypothetical protein AUG44_03395 [Actinobacteria bacterium 13_1_20CM_3_71_11]|nr:MAG: hypothetical protein AUG44_03395 [Actinobacteria bacterium 13_1_20CM_3_71_11]